MHRNERRRYPRCETRETATVVCESVFSGRFLVANLSAGGALLVGEYLLPMGANITLLLEVPERPALSLSGRVVRKATLESGCLAFGVAFEPESQGIRLLRQYVDGLLQEAIVDEAIEHLSS